MSGFDDFMINEAVTLRQDVQRLMNERDAWERTAAQFCRNEEYYRGLVVRIGKAIGDQAYIAEDGSRSEDVLCAKVPELVEATLKGQAA
jgi:hypothetical protein